MNIAVVYQSRGGNTRAVAEVIANTLGISAYSIDAPFEGGAKAPHTDLLFVGGGVYGWNADKKLVEFMEALDQNRIGKIAAFGTGAGMSQVIDRIKELASAKGIAVAHESLCLKMTFRGYALLGIKGGKLSDKQIERVRQFARNAAAESNAKESLQ